MEDQPPSGSYSAAYPRWDMLEQYLEVKVEDDSCSPTGDAKTLAASRTSAGHLIQVSLRLADPPALSRVILRIPDGLKEEKSKVLAAHGDSVLIQVRIKEKNPQYYTVERFVYNAGGAHAAAPPRPPSLWLLPPYYVQAYFSGSDLVPRELFDGNTGLLRRGEDEFVVAELSTAGSLSEPMVGALFMFHSGQWKYHNIRIREDWDLDLRYVSWDTVVAVDDRLLCWVNLRLGVMLIDVLKEKPTVQYVKLPMDPRDCGRGINRNVCTTAGGGTLKFVNIFGRCCCGAAASCDCEHSRHAYTIHTWTMRIGNGDMEWVKDGMVDATELWVLDAYKGLDLPCYPLDRPIVSIDEPEVICFRMRDKQWHSRALWQIMVNMRSKTIHSVSRHEEDHGYCYTRDKLIPSKVSYFFNTYPSSGRSDDATLTRESQIDIERSPSVLIDEPQIGDDDASNPTLQASEIFEAFQEIPSYGLGPDEVKAYRILSNNNGRRLRSLLRLPKNIRKNWLLIEIKASED